jgi:hypothetical protein
VAGLVNDDYDKFRRELGIRNLQYSRYGFLFHFCYSNTVNIVTKKLPGELVSFVLEGGHKNEGDALKIFNIAKFGKVGASGKRPPVGPYLESITFAFGLSSLEAADFLVNKSYRDLRDGKL